MTVSDRLRVSRRRAGFSSAAAAAEAFGWPLGTYYGHENGHRGMSWPTIMRYARAFRVDALWLLSGITDQKASWFAAEDRVQKGLYPDDYNGWDETMHVEVRELSAAAGGGTMVDREEVIGRIAFRRSWLTKHGVDPSQAVVITVRGESMEPTLPDGCSILVDRRRTRRAPGRIYVLRTEDGLIVKRAGRDGGHWLLLSDHPAWDPIPWPGRNVPLGEVRWMARTLG